VIIGLIVLSFAAFGLETLLPGGSGTSVAEVNGEEITPFALQEAITQQKRQLVSVLGDNIDPALLDDDRLQPRALQSLIPARSAAPEEHGIGSGRIRGAGWQIYHWH
jgi:peptidyl-prolyl cis-trans isomerase D